MAKVTVIGSGNVGATCANVLAHKDIVKEVVLLDIQGNMAKGKALDTWQQAPIDSYSTTLTGTDDYELTANSDIVVIQISQVFPVTGDVPGVLEISRRLWIPGGTRLRMVALKQNRGSVRSPCSVRL